MTNPEALRAMEGLTKAQRAAINAQAPYPHWDTFANPDIDSLQHLVGIGVLDHSEDDSMEYYRLTPLGEQVRTALQEQDNG